LVKISLYGKPSFYWQYLRSPQWQRTRMEYLRRIGWRCERCYTRKTALVHHLSYGRLGSEQPEDLMGLCKECHDKMHRWPTKAANDNSQLEIELIGGKLRSRS
jgi:5-methylcytosine-specific restriction endonuclease McrA